MRTCPRCRRANPEDAVYCHHDGILLRGDEARKHPSGIPDRFHREWIYPSGRRCITREELLKGCLSEWEASAVAYSSGHLGRFLQEVSNGNWMPPAMPIDTSDDLSLQVFLEQIADPDRPPRPIVELFPRRLQLDVRPGETPSLMLRISNRGDGLLHGTIQVGDGAGWIQLEGPNGPTQSIEIATRLEQSIPIRILTRNLPSSGSYIGKLVLRTNGGTLELPVLANLVGGTTFQGYSIGSPRDLAKLLRDHPKDALKWLDNGSIARWFADNGHSYPVRGPIAPGFAAIQQLFEALGFARSPEIRLEDREIHLICRHPEVLTESVFLKTSEEKWVFAFLSCDEFWLKLAEDSVSGPKKAEIQFTIDSSLLEAGKIYETAIHLTANGDQTFKLKVMLDIKRPHEPFTRRILRPFFSN